MKIVYRQPNWDPLIRLLSRKEYAGLDVSDFMYMGDVGSIVLYKHRITRRYLNIDASSGRFYQYTNLGYAEVSKECALRFVCDLR